MKIRLLLLSLFLLSACTTTRTNPSMALMSEGDVESAIDRNTVRKRVYDGFQNIMEVSITAHNSAVLAALLDQNARLYQWNAENFSLEKNKVDATKSNQTDFFLSFFVPEKKYDDLHRKTSSWKVFLDINGRRLEGRVTKVKGNYAEIRALYPHFTRWNTAYLLSFGVPTADIDMQPSSVTITGPVGSVTAEFSPSGSR